MQKLAAALTLAAELDAQMTGIPVTDDFRKKMDLLGAGIFRLVVMGEIKKGKSSFINALLGYKELVPTSSNVATSTIFKIHYGKEVAYKVFFTVQSGKGEQAISAADLPLFGTEDGNPGNEKQVDFIEVSCPSPLLKTGVVIIDTPGLGGTFREHKKITYQYVPKADAVFFVTDSVESPIGALEIEYLKDIQGITRHVYYVQTKTAAVDEEAANARRENNLGILSRALGVSPGETPYFMLDSEVRHMAAQQSSTDMLQLSGYPALLAFVNKRLLPAKRQILARKAVTAATPTLEHLISQVEEKEQMLNADTADSRNRAQAEIQRAQDELTHWETEEKDVLVRSIFKGLDDNVRAAMAFLSQCQPYGSIQMEMENAINRASTREQLMHTMRVISNNLPGFAAQCMQAVAAQLQAGTQQVLGTCCPEITALSGEVNTGVPAINNFRIERMLRDMANDGGREFAKLRTGMYGGMAGMAMASVVGGVIGSVVPVVGTFIGSSIGMAIAGMWGSSQACMLQEQQELQSLRSQASAALSTTIGDMYSKMQANINQLNADVKYLVQDALANTLRQRSRDLQSAIADLQERAQMTGEALRQRKEGLAALRQQLASIKRTIAAYIPVQSNPAP